MYNTFLMIELARIAGVIPKDLEYDLTYEAGIGLTNEFEKSEFNNGNKSLYECTQDFLKTQSPII